MKVMNNNLMVIESNVMNVYANQNNEKVVDARELWIKLEVKTEFAKWINRRFDEVDAVENVDFGVFVKNGDNLNGGRPTTEYILKLDTAKEIAMLERNEIGKQIRRYFIEVEKKYTQQVQKFYIPKTLSEALLLASDLAQKVEEQNVKIDALENEVFNLECTKAQINNKKTATALGKLGNTVKELNKVRNQLGQGKDFATLKAVAGKTKAFNYSWRELKAYSNARELPIIDVPDPNYGTVKAYSKEAWSQVYNINIEVLFGGACNE
jgi:phage anti-repressor protein